MARATGKTTTPKAVTAASKVMTDGRTGAKSKTAAASALSQTPARRTAKPKKD